jgi:hypothetical protein
MKRTAQASDGLRGARDHMQAGGPDESNHQLFLDYPISMIAGDIPKIKLLALLVHRPLALAAPPRALGRLLGPFEPGKAV